MSILQVVLALHTALGAAWMSSNPAKTMPTLGAIPSRVWQSLTVLDLLYAIALIVPLFNRRAAILAPIGAAFVVAEMLYYSGVHLASGSTSMGPVIYWLVVAAVAAFIIYGRLARKPIRRSKFA